MTVFLTLRSGASGPAFVGENDGDTLLWSVAQGKFYVGPGGAGAGVESFNGRTGVVVPADGDYDSDQVDNASTVAGASVSDALEHLQTEIDAVDLFQKLGSGSQLVNAGDQFDAGPYVVPAGFVIMPAVQVRDNLEQSWGLPDVAVTASCMWGLVGVTGDPTSFILRLSNSSGANVTFEWSVMAAKM